MPSIKKNFLYSSLLTTAGYVFPLITFPYVSRVLGVTNIGICNFIDSIINYFIYFSMLGIDLVGIREIAKNKSDKEKLKKTFNELFTLNTITTSIALLLLLTATLSIDQLTRNWHLMAVGAVKLTMNYMLVEWLYKGLEEFRYITIRTIIVKAFYVILIFIFIKESSDYPTYYLLTVLSIAINAIINITHSRKFVSLHIGNIHHLNLGIYLKPVLTIAAYLVLTSMYTTFNVIFLGFVSGETEVGYYTTGAKLFQVIMSFFGAFTSVMLPRMSSLVAEGKGIEFRLMLEKSYKILFNFSVPLLLFSFIYAPFIIEIIAGSGYDGAIVPMRIIIILLLINGYEQIIIIQALAPLKKDNAIIKNSLIGAATGVILNLVLVPSQRSVGSAVVWVISEFVVLCCAQYHIHDTLRICFPWKFLLRALLINIPLTIMIYLSYQSNLNMIASFICGASIVVVYSLFVNIKMINREFLGGKLSVISKAL